MRIHHLLDSSGFGGIESHVGLLIEEQAARGHEARLVLLERFGPHPLLDRLEAGGLATMALDGRFGSLLQALRELPPEILHTHGYKAGILGRLAGKIARIPVVSTFHNGDRGTGLLRLYTALDRGTAFLSSNIAVSRTIGRGLPHCAILPNFVSVRGLADRPRTGPPVIGFVGRLAPEKGPDRFVALAARLGVPAVLFGDGPMRASLEASAPPGVIFAGRVGSMDAHWQRIGLLVMSSRAEGLPLAALEAMAEGVPVAAFALGGLTDLIDDTINGFLASADDEAALETAVRRWLLLPESDRAALSSAARDRVEGAYSARRIIPEIEAIYAKVRVMQAANRPLATCENSSPASPE